MDERFLEMAEANLAKNVEANVKARSAQAISDTNLSPHEYITHECDDCGVALPEFRKQKGLIRCVPCQEQIERRKK